MAAAGGVRIRCSIAIGELVIRLQGMVGEYRILVGNPADAQRAAAGAVRIRMRNQGRIDHE